MPSLSDTLRACQPLLPQPFRAEHARLFAEDEHLARLADRLLAFSQDGVPDTFPLPRFSAECTPPLAEAFAFFRPAVAEWTTNPDNPELPKRFTDALLAASCGPVLVLLGQRRTPASISDARAIPPPRSRLLGTATRLHSPADALTVAARALTKHVHRSPEEFWGQVTGSAADKNALALRRLEDILDRTTWWNVFGHFKHELVYEARVAGGHGARWGRLGEEFIGFLEPFDEGRGVAGAGR
jgi:hypothetical protein